jgi:hypothetical protein
VSRVLGGTLTFAGLRVNRTVYTTVYGSSCWKQRVYSGKVEVVYRVGGCSQHFYMVPLSRAGRY